MQRLIEGLHQFRENVVGAHQHFFESLARGQHPSTLFITCSDSRVNPNLITQTGPGELFTIRNAGCIVPPFGTPGGEAAAIEYAVAVLHVVDIVICGHSHCGAMSAIALDTPMQALPALERWLEHAAGTKKIIEDNYKHLQGPQRIMATVQENVLVQLEHLRTHPTVAEAYAKGLLRLHGWVYKIETGEVFAYDGDQGQFLPLVPQSQEPPSEPIPLDM